MSDLRIRSATGQLVDHLKHEIRVGRWTDRMPGETWLVKNLQVGRRTVRTAMAQLEKEGVLVSHGQGRWRRIAMNRDAITTRKIRVRILLYEKRDRGDIDNATLLAQLRRRGLRRISQRNPSVTSARRSSGWRASWRGIPPMPGSPSPARGRSMNGSLPSPSRHSQCMGGSTACRWHPPTQP